MEDHAPGTQPAPSTLYQKLSVPLLTLGVALLVFFFKWLFGMMYPQDSYRVYTNWEITELTAENLLTEKRLDGIRQTIDRKGVKNLYLDSINDVTFNSAGKLLSADFTIFACTPGESQGQLYRLTLSEDIPSSGNPAKLERLEGYVSIDLETLSDRAPYEALYTLSHHPLSELANQNPIANESSFIVRSPGGDITVETDRTSNALKEEIEGGCVWFVRDGGGWFTVTAPGQISPQFLPVLVLTAEKDSEPSIYGWMMLEIPSPPENNN